jgi:hypothetical protein
MSNEDIKTKLAELLFNFFQEQGMSEESMKAISVEVMLDSTKLESSDGSQQETHKTLFAMAGQDLSPSSNQQLSLMKCSWHIPCPDGFRPGCMACR